MWLGSLGFALGVDGFIRSRWVHSGSRWGSFSSSGVVVFTRVRPGGRWVRSRCHWVHAPSLGSLGFALRVVGFIRDRWVHSDSPFGSLGSSEFVGFTRVCPMCRCVHPTSLGSLSLALGVVGFIWCRWVHSGSPWRTLGSSGVV